jgi:putative tryptophan/tyrosine transport system substrate-binding protein
MSFSSGGCMQRREFITLFGGTAATWPLAARAQQPAKMKRIAIVSPATKIGDMGVNGIRFYRMFFEELGRLGYDEGRNLVVERYSGEGRTEHYADLARDVVNTHPDLIFCISYRLALNFKAATTTIPIAAITADPIALGLASSLARPGGNITGISVDAGIEVMGKRLGLLLEATSKLSNARFLVSQLNWEGVLGAAVREASGRAGISLAGEPMSSFNEQEYQRVFNSMEHERVDGILVSDEAEQLTYRQLLVELAAKTRIPTIYAFREHVELGGLMAYSIDLGDVGRRAARQIAQILKGANPGELPFYQQTKFELTINLKTAKALGLNLPPMLLGRADEVIE